MVAMVTAGITVDIATCCREGRLKDCPCVYPQWRRNVTTDSKGAHTVTYAACGDNVETAKERTKQIMGVASESYLRSVQATVEDKVDFHNAALGTRVSFACFNYNTNTTDSIVILSLLAKCPWNK